MQCGVERCPLYRTLSTVDLLRCLEQRCAAAVPRGSQLEDAAKKTSSDCAAACSGQVGSTYLKCLSESCDLPERPVASAFCPSLCQVISPDNVEGCLQHYCPHAEDQEDEGAKKDTSIDLIQEEQNGEQYAKEDEGGSAGKRWGNRLNSMRVVVADS